jgi:hypothetical protein
VARPGLPRFLPVPRDAMVLDTDEHGHVGCVGLHRTVELVPLGQTNGLTHCRHYCQGSREFLSCDHVDSPPVRAGRRAFSAAVPDEAHPLAGDQGAVAVELDRGEMGRS